MTVGSAQFLRAAASFSQERQWVLTQLDATPGRFVVSSIRRFDGVLDAERLADSLAAVVHRHEVLRTGVVETGASLEQHVYDTVELPFELTQLDASISEAQVGDAIDGVIGTAFDLACPPLFRVAVIRLGGETDLVVAAFHHMIVDATSVSCFFRDWAAAYDAGPGTSPHSALPPLSTQYRHFAEWQRAYVSGRHGDDARRYWRRRLANVPDLLDLPLDRRRPATRDHRGAAVPVALSSSAKHDLLTFAREARVTPFMSTVAAWSAFIGKFTHESVVPVGTYVDTRERRELESVLGFFTNILVLNTELNRGIAYEELVRETRRTTLEAFVRRHLPFEWVLEELRPARDTARTPLFQIMCDWQEATDGEVTFGGLRSASVHRPHNYAEFDLTLRGNLDGLEIVYSTDIFDRATAEELAAHFGSFFERLVRDASTPIERVPMLPRRRRQLVLATARSPWRGRKASTVSGYLAKHARARPSATAVADNGTAVTYAELDWEARRIASCIRDHGLAGDGVVAVYCEPSAAQVAGLFGAMYAGNAVLPLDVHHPARRLAAAIRQSGARLVVTQRALLDNARELSVSVLAMDAPETGHSVTSDVAVSDPTALAYIVFTSGSTGLPKGIAVEHQNIVPLLEWSREQLHMSESTRTLHALSATFDFGLYELFATIAVGGTLHFADRSPLDGSAYVDYANEHGINTLHLTPSLLAILVETGRRLDSLELLHVGGEPFPWELAAAARALVPRRCRIYNGYGPTETSVNATIYEVPRDRPTAASATVPIGRPTARTHTYVLDGGQNLLPPHAIGELYIGGRGVARGYIGDPSLTAERFVRDPFVSDRDARMYRTGDLVRARDDGTLEFIGRVDDQIKVSGVRIEPAEVEACLREHPAVRDAVAVQTDGPPPRRLVALIVPADETVPLAENLRAFAAERLPTAMVPASFRLVPQLPRTTNGKIDRKAATVLAATGDPLPERRLSGSDDERVRKLTQVFAAVLGRANVGADDNFFELGGNSLMAARIAVRIERELGLALPLRLILEQPTIRQIAQATLARTTHTQIPRLSRLRP